MGITKQMQFEQMEKDAKDDQDVDDLDWGFEEAMAREARHEAQQEERERLAGDDKLKQLTALADHYRTIEAEIEEMEDRLKTLNETFRRVREDFIPEKMMELGVKKYTLTDGSTIGYSQIFAGKVLDERGYDWLEEHGYADAVKQELKLEVSRVDSAALDFIKEYISKNQPGFFSNMSIKEKQAIHHMTLGAAIKVLTKRGQQLPPELFETFIGNRATIKKGRDNG